VLTVFCFVEEIMKILSKLMLVGVLACATVAPSSAVPWLNGNHVNEIIENFKNGIDSAAMENHINAQIEKIVNGRNNVDNEAIGQFKARYVPIVVDLLRRTLRNIINNDFYRELSLKVYDTVQEVSSSLKRLITGIIGQTIPANELDYLTSEIETALVEFISNNPSVSGPITSRYQSSLDSESEYESDSEYESESE
jgi:hypothetical protein